MSKLSEEERKEMLRDARAKDELEKATIKLVAKKEEIARLCNLDFSFV